MSVDEYLQSILPKDKNDLSLDVAAGEDEFENDMKEFAEDFESQYKGTYSRKDIYFDHD